MITLQAASQQPHQVLSFQHMDIPQRQDLHAFIEAAPQLVLVVDPKLTIVAVNSALLHATKMPREAVVGRYVFDAFPDNPHDPGGSDALLASFDRVLKSKAADRIEPHRYDVRVPPEEGGHFVRRFWRVSNYPVLDAQGEVAYIVHHSEEVTELMELRSREAERVARLAEAHSQAVLEQRATDILESITDGFFALDREWRFTYVNRQCQRILDRARTDLLGHVIWEEYPGLFGSEFERVYRRAMVADVASSVTSYYPDHDRWYEVHAYPAADGISVYFRNVTLRKRAEEERERVMAESEKQRRIYEAALSNTPDLVYVFDLDHRFTYANEALLTMWGRTREDALGKNCLELGYEPWHAEMHDREIEQVIATRKPIRGEVPFTGTHGRRIYDYIFVPVIGANGEVVAVAGTTRDVTERQQAEQAIREQAERLRQVDRAKDEFLATLAHELRNPLAPIVNSLELLKRDSANGELSRIARGTLERQVRHLVRLVDDLLDVSRITRGKLELRPERVLLSSIVEQAVEASRPQVESAGHRLSVAMPASAIYVEADPVRVVQIVGNLLNNAAKYTPTGGRISVNVEPNGANVAVHVRDSGIGIAPEMLEKIFDMFARADQSLERTQDGLGVGLSLARKLAELHGGSIAARSEGLGTGSEFVLTLPIAD